jgi:hypothetical protein
MDELVKLVYGAPLREYIYIGVQCLGIYARSAKVLNQNS